MISWLKITLVCGITVLVAEVAQAKNAGTCLIGVTQHYGIDEGTPQETLSIMKQAGFNSFRAGAEWNLMEKDGKLVNIPGNLTAAVAQAGNMEPLVILAYSAKTINNRYPWRPEDAEKFNDYVRFVMRQFKDNVRYYQVWNEWDYGTGMDQKIGGENSAENYVAFLKQVAPIIRAENQKAIILANSVCTKDEFLFETFKAGVLDYCDAYTIHVYDNFGTPEHVLKRLLRCSEESKKYNSGIPKDFYVTEMSWPVSPDSVDAEQQADYLARFGLLCKTVPGFRGIWWYSFNERGYDWKRQGLFFGTVMTDFSPKPAYFAYQSIAPILKESLFLRRITCDVPGTHLLLFQMPDGQQVLAAWTEREDTRVRLVLDRNGADTDTVDYVLCGSPVLKRHWGFRDQYIVQRDKPYMELCENFTAPENRELFSFQVTTRPVLLYGVPADFKIVRTDQYIMPKRPKNTSVVLWRGGTVIPEKELAWKSTSGEAYCGEKDLSFELFLHRSKEKFCVDVIVNDDIHHPADGKGDAVKLGILLPGKGDEVFPARYLEYSMYDGGKIAHLMARQINGEYFKSKASWNITEKNGKRVYAIAIPWQELGTELTVLQREKWPIGLSAVVYDDDGQGRKGYMKWADNASGWGYDAPVGWVVFR